MSTYTQFPEHSEHTIQRLHRTERPHSACQWVCSAKIMNTKPMHGHRDIQAGSHAVREHNCHKICDLEFIPIQFPLLKTAYVGKPFLFVRNPWTSSAALVSLPAQPLGFHTDFPTVMLIDNSWIDAAVRTLSTCSWPTLTPVPRFKYPTVVIVNN